MTKQVLFLLSILILVIGCSKPSPTLEDPIILPRLQIVNHSYDELSNKMFFSFEQLCGDCDSIETVGYYNVNIRNSEQEVVNYSYENTFRCVDYCATSLIISIYRANSKFEFGRRYTLRISVDLEPIECTGKDEYLTSDYSFIF